nr:MDR family MFS transporter [uncultured Devosia sp.]
MIIEKTDDLDEVRDPAGADGKAGLLIWLMIASAFVVILNETIMGVAIPHLMSDLDITASTAQWLTTAFLLTMAIVIPVTGFLLDRFQTRSLFVAAMSLFSLGTLLAATAPGFNLLVVGRIVQASGTAVMLPLLMTTVMRLIAPEKRGRMMGRMSIVISVAPAIGPTLSGLVLSVLDWRWLFWLVLPIALLSLSAGARWIVNGAKTTAKPLDVLSALLSALGFGGLVYGLSLLGEGAHGYAPVSGWMAAGIGTLALLVFVVRQIALQRNDRALLDLRTFLSPAFTVSLVVIAISMMALFGSLILLPLYTQNALGLDVLQTGLLLLPGGLVMGLMAPLVGRAFDRVGPRPLVIPGSVIVSAMMWAMTLLDQHTPVILLLAGHVVLSIGLSLMFTPLFTSGLSALPPQLYSHGSATISTIQQVAGAAGTALFIGLMSMKMGELSAAGAALPEATAGGVHLAFLCGGAISLVAVLASLFVRRPAEGVKVMGLHH